MTPDQYHHMTRMVRITLERAIALQQKETAPEKRTRRKAFMFPAMYSGLQSDAATLFLPLDLVEPEDL